MQAKYTLAAGLAALTLGAAWMPSEAVAGCCRANSAPTAPGDAMSGGVGGRGGGGGGAGATGSGATAATGGVKPTTGRTTVPTAIPRGQGSRELLDLRWNYPVRKADAVASGTAVEKRREAFSRAQAIESVAEDDPRPLLVLRECTVCNKTDDALLSRNESNERTLVLARFFRCVKLPVDVVQPDHAFHALFPSNDAEHLFVSARDGSAKRPLESDTSRVELWTAMEATLSAAYGIDASKVVKQVVVGLDRVDELERKVTALETRKGVLMESPKVDAGKVKAVDADLAAARAEADAAKAAVAALFAIEPKAAAPAASGAVR